MGENMKINDELILDILRFNNEGDGVAKYNNFVIFVKNALKGEKVKAVITEIKDNYAVGIAKEVIEESKDRINPICPYYKFCGGCNLLHMTNDLELEFKKDLVKNVLKKISNVDINISDIKSYNEIGYRNKISLKVKDNKIGLYQEKSNKLVTIDRCLLVSERVNDIINKLKDIVIDSNISEIVIREIDEKIMVMFDKLNKDISLDVDSIYVGDECIFGSKYLVKEINGYKFVVSPKSFFQVNSLTAENLYDKVVSYINKNDRVLDLYSGTGTISILMSKNAKEVTGVEVIQDAVKDANKNLELNNISNVNFICSKVEDVIDRFKNIDFIVLDPPRGGSDKKSLRTILSINPKNIVYISCNPITLARDYNTLKNNYVIKEISLFNMFPKTNHVETVMVLEKKDV